MRTPTTADPDPAATRSNAGMAPVDAIAPAIAVATGSLLVVAAFAGGAPLASFVTVALLVPAAMVDLRERRLPDAWVGAAAIGFVVTAALVSAVSGASLPWRDVVVGACVMAGPLLALHLVSPDAMGFGDVKAATVLGMAAGAVAWELALTSLTLAAGAAGAVGLLARRRTVAFGPFLVVSTALSLALASRWLTTGVGT